MNSCLTLSLVTGMRIADVSQIAMANLAWDEIRLPAPVFVGDTIYASSEILEMLESKSRPDVGVVRFQDDGLQSARRDGHRVPKNNPRVQTGAPANRD